MFEIKGKHILVTGGSSGFDSTLSRPNDEFFESENGKALIKPVWALSGPRLVGASGLMR